MDKDTKQMFELILTKLDGIEKRQENMDNRLGNMEKRQEGMENRLENMDNRLEGMEKRQDEMYLMQRALEENAKVTRAEQEKMMYILVDIQGKVTKLTEEVEEHETVINQIRAIK